MAERTAAMEMRSSELHKTRIVQRRYGDVARSQLHRMAHPEGKEPFDDGPMATAGCHAIESGPREQEHYDGKDSPVTGNPDADMVARRLVNPTTVETLAKKDGKVISTQRSVVSKDGMTRTVTTKGVNAKGETMNNVAVYDKQ